jgi:exopolysaccharide biosynthesis polyprenyl glycosylphosphotransferase
MSEKRDLALSVMSQMHDHAVPKSWRLHISERRLLLLAGDLAAISLALMAALYFRLQALGVIVALTWPNSHFIWWLVLWGLWFPLALISNLYDLHLAADLTRSAVYAAGCALLTSAIYLVFPIYSAPLTRSRLSWLIFCVTAMLMTAVWRFIYARYIVQPAFSRNILIVGAGVSGTQLVQELLLQGDAAGAAVIGFVDRLTELHGTHVAGVPVLGDGTHLRNLAESMDANDIVVAITEPGGIRPELMAALVDCWADGINVVPMLTYYEQITGAVPVECIGQNLFALVAPRYALQRLWDALRRVLDLVAGMVGLTVCVPFLPLIALAIVIDCPGPVFYRQSRVGQNGHLFDLAKFRSMIPNAENGRAIWAQENDDRVTRVGRIMRKMRIDELPQLWNLINGTMTLIGPRPERPEFVKDLAQQIPYYAIRHAIKPGLTGWAQVKYRYGNTVEDAQSKLQYDLYYLKHRGPVLDTSIVLHTVRTVLRMEGS